MTKGSAPKVLQVSSCGRGGYITCTEKASNLPEVTQPVAAELVANTRPSAGGWAGKEEEVAGAGSR